MILTGGSRIRSQQQIVIVVAGNSAAEEGEYVYADMEELYVKSMGGDRTQGIALPAHDREILSAVAQVRQDAIVVLVGGSSFTMEDWIGQTGALLMAYYPGMYRFFAGTVSCAKCLGDFNLG